MGQSKEEEEEERRCWKLCSEEELREEDYQFPIGSILHVFSSPFLSRAFSLSLPSLAQSDGSEFQPDHFPFIGAHAASPRVIYSAHPAEHNLTKPPARCVSQQAIMAGQ